MKSSPPPSPSPALSPPSDHKPDKEELIKGRDLAIALRAVLRNQQKGSWLESAGTHVENVVKLFTQAISARDSDESPESGQNPASILVCSSTSDDQSVEYSGKRGKGPVSKERREAYKRRRITSEIWTQVTATPLDDGLGWRKYGQKPILGAKHPRSYFRCTHKNDQNCGATKQVQKMEEDCSMYLVTYMGKHTCKDSNQAPPIILDYTPTEKCLLNFQSAPIRREGEVLPNPYLSSTLTSVKHEVDERNKLGHLDHKGSPASSSYSTAFSDQRAFESSTVPSMEFSAMEYMVSGLCSVTSSPIMDMVDSVGIEDMFNFYDEEFLGPFDQQQG